MRGHVKNRILVAALLLPALAAAQKARPTIGGAAPVNPPPPAAPGAGTPLPPPPPAGDKPNEPPLPGEKEALQECKKYPPNKKFRWELRGEIDLMNMLNAMAPMLCRPFII